MKRFARITVLLIGLLVCLSTDNSIRAKSYSRISANQNPVQVSFCDLIRNPGLYHQKLITTEAIVVVNFMPVVDGGEPFLYNQKCNKAGFFIMPVFHPAISPPTQIDLTINEIFSTAEKNKTTGRANMLITGTFYQAPENSGFGHLSGAKFKLDTQKVEKAAPVTGNTPWPSWWKEKPKQ